MVGRRPRVVFIEAGAVGTLTEGTAVRRTAVSSAGPSRLVIRAPACIKAATQVVAVGPVISGNGRQSVARNPAGGIASEQMEAGTFTRVVVGPGMVALRGIGSGERIRRGRSLFACPSAVIVTNVLMAGAFKILRIAGKSRTAVVAMETVVRTRASTARGTLARAVLGVGGVRRPSGRRRGGAGQARRAPIVRTLCEGEGLNRPTRARSCGGD